MIFRLCQKLAKKIKVAPPESLPLGSNAFADWSARLFTADRSQYIILTNTASLYSVVLFGRGVADVSQFVRRVRGSLREHMEDDGQEPIYRQFVSPATRTVRFSKALNRSVDGSMSNLVHHAKFWLTEGGLSPHDTSFRLNEIPMSPLRYQNAREVFVAMKAGQSLIDAGKQSTS